MRSLLFGMSWEAQERLSTMIGYASIGAWLFAQMPQVLENHRNQSVEGIALPFLLSWLFGDLTNLIGCVLTHQLPFQTYLATYFVLVDVMLTAQYIYYSKRNPIQSIPPLSAEYPYAQAPHHHHSSHHHHHGIRRSKSYHRSTSTSKHHHTHHRSSRTRTLNDDEDEVDADLLAQSWMSESSTATTPARQPSLSAPTSRATSYHQIQPLASSSKTPSISLHPSEPPSPSQMTTTTTSSNEQRGRTLTRSRFINPSMLETISGSPASGSPTPIMRALMNQEQLQHEVNERRTRIVGVGTGAGVGESLPSNAILTRGSTRSGSRSRPAGPSRRSSSILFLSVGIWFTFRNAYSNNPIADITLNRDGSSNRAWEIPSILRSPRTGLIKRQQSLIDTLDLTTTTMTTTTTSGRDWERFIGRASAWLCTTLYLTSRLPQIWQNFRRRSVAGLSMLLFIMAFIGNSLYVTSILLNPNAFESIGYLIESTPYLLGSGGTLCFDITIVLQSWLYSEKRREARRRKRFGRTSSAFGGVGAEEEEGLLNRRNEGEEGEEEEESRKRRRRKRSSSSKRLNRTEEPFKMSRSVSSRRTSIGTQLTWTNEDASMTPPRSGGRERVHSSRAERGVLDDLEFDFDRSSRTVSTSGSPVQTTLLPSSRSRSRTTSHDALFPLGAVQEVGESNVTIRAVE